MEQEQVANESFPVEQPARTTEVISKEYSQLCTKAGDLAFQHHAVMQQLDQLATEYAEAHARENV